MTPAEANSLAVFSSYNFSASGPGTFIFDPVSTFQVIGLNESCETTFGATRINATNAGSVSITVINDVSKRELNLKKRQEVKCEVPHQRFFVENSVDEATTMATKAIIYMKENGDGDQLYQTYFGRNPIVDVMANFNRVVNQKAFQGAISCSDPGNVCKSNSNMIMHTQTSGSRVDTYYCDSFHSLKHTKWLCTGTSADDPNVRGSQTLRGLVYALTPGAYKQVDGCSESQGLPDDKKFLNLDNYMASTQILRCLPRARVLTRGRNLCSASLPQSTSEAVVLRDENIREGGVSYAMCAFG